MKQLKQNIARTISPHPLRAFSQRYSKGGDRRGGRPVILAKDSQVIFCRRDGSCPPQASTDRPDLDPAELFQRVGYPKTSDSKTFLHLAANVSSRGVRYLMSGRPASSRLTPTSIPLRLGVRLTGFEFTQLLLGPSLYR